ncbi:vWA domain-containing protein [Shewanella sp. UCD-KL12]|uniref:vWA domain-containing protein n=1 Tax=Shewanella sp. UCD-KL12 TaxID=1917163 RepID=UPI000970A00E|nr:vWA domain-containing protein [Shewanella sp. UCD-KL12]
MSTQQQLLRKFKNLSRVLTRSTDMEIVFHGKRAGHSPGRIVLPMGDFSDDDFVTMSLGYCDHELGHENYTDNNWYRIAQNKSPYLRGLLNSLDDAHQERRLMADFKGCTKTLNNLVKLCIEKGLFAEPYTEHKETLILKGWVLYGARVFIGNPLNGYFLKADNLLKAKFGDDFYREANLIFNETVFQTMDSTEKCFVVAEKLYLLLLDWVDQQDSQDDPSDSDDADGSEGSRDDSSDSDDADGSEDSRDDSSDSDDADGSEDSSDDSSDSDDADGSEDSNDDSSDSDDADGSEDSSDDSSSGKTTTRKKDILASLEDEIDDLHEKLRAELDSMAKDYDGSQIAPLKLKIDDKSERTNCCSDPHNVEEECHKLISNLKSPLKRIFHDQNYRHVTLDKKGCSLSSSRLSSVVTGNKRIFEQESIGRSPNSAIALLVDKSGSMSAAEMSMASSVAYSMSAALDSIKGVSNMVGYYPGLSFIDGSNSVLDFYDHSLNIVKPFETKVRKNSFNIISEGGTPTAEAITSALALLVNQSAPRKLLFVITDGDPDNAAKVQRAIVEANCMGVRVFGIGIHRKVDGFDDADFSVINDSNELVQALTKGLKHAFK